MPKYKDGQPPAPPKSGREIGSTSNIVVGGFINTSEYNMNLKGAKRVQTYDEMRFGDATVKSALLAVMLPILSARWRIDSVSEKRADQQVADFVTWNIFENMTRSWREILNEILLFTVYGNMPFELVWEFQNDQICLHKMSSRWPDTIQKWELSNGEDGVIQQTTQGTFEIPMDKMVIFVNQREGDNWEGVSILRSAYKHWYMKDKLYLIDAVATERQGLGIPMARREGLANDGDNDEVERILRNIRANEEAFVISPKGWIFEFMDMKAGTTRNPTPMIQHHNRQILVNVLAQFIDLGSSNVGSFALSSDQSKLFIQSLESIANYITETMNKYVIKKLVDYNFDVEAYPKLMFDKIGTVDINNWSTALQRLMQIKVITPDSTLEEYARDIMDLPDYTGTGEIDESMLDPMINELNGELSTLTQETPVVIGQPAPDPTQQDIQNAYDLDTENGGILFGGAPGVPLSEETKRKISEALSKGKGSKGGKGKTKANPEVTKRTKQIADLRKQVQAFSSDARRDVLELKAKGIKLDPQEAAKKQLEFFNKKDALSKKITQLQSEIAAVKDAQPQPAPKKKASEEEEDLPLLKAIRILDAYGS